jgi:hypothetical protein
MIYRYCISIKILILLIVTGLTGIIQADIIHVPGQVGTIKAGILAAQTGDTIMVSAGTYSGPGNRDLDFGGKAITVRSMKGSTVTVIDCQGSKEFPHRGFRAHQREDSTTVISGFTIINGYAPFDGPGGEAYGGGILCENSTSPTIKDCVLFNNYASRAGGGLCCIEGSSPIVSHCTFVSNTAISDTTAFIEGLGGGIRCESSSPRFSFCTISSNRANIGGGMSCNDAHPVMEYCEFNGNTADVIITFEPYAPGFGGGLHLYYASPTLSHCVFDRNIAISGQNMEYMSAQGGGLACYHSTPTLINCTIFGNTAEEYGPGMPGHGAGIYLFDSPAQVENTVIAYNFGGEAVGCPFDTSCTDTLPVFLCTDIYGNELGDWTDSIASQQGINGNFSEPPYFCDPWIGNFGLWIHSPCSADSSECGVLIGAYDAICVTDAEDSDPRAPGSYSLSQNHPNPFNQATLVEYILPVAGHVELTVYNTLGQTVRQLTDGYRPAGQHRVSWDGRDANGYEVASGVYLYILRAGEFSEARRMVLLK